MKRILVIAAALLCGVVAQAQNLSLEAGYANVSYKGSFEVFSTKYNKASTANGFYFGVGYEHAFTDIFSLATGLQFVYAGSKQNGVNYNDFDLILPVDAKVYLPFGSAVKGFLFAGPALKCGLLSQAKVDTISYDYYSDLLNRFQLLLGGGVGLEVNNTVAIKVSYNYGVLNLLKNADKTTKLNNAIIEAGFVVRF